MSPKRRDYNRKRLVGNGYIVDLLKKYAPDVIMSLAKPSIEKLGKFLSEKMKLSGSGIKLVGEGKNPNITPLMRPGDTVYYKKKRQAVRSVGQQKLTKSY
jgi:hypothetical protein